MISRAVFFLLIASPLVLCNDYTKALENLDRKLHDYDKRIRPGVGEKPINVTCSMYIIRAYDFNEKTSVSYLLSVTMLPLIHILFFNVVHENRYLFPTSMEGWSTDFLSQWSPNQRWRRSWESHLETRHLLRLCLQRENPWCPFPECLCSNQREWGRLPVLQNFRWSLLWAQEERLPQDLCPWDRVIRVLNWRHHVRMEEQL